MTTERWMRLRSFCDATRARDIDRIVSTLAPDAELLSPLSGRMVFRGRDDLRVLLGAVYGGLSDLTWREIIGDGHDPGGRQRRTDRGCRRSPTRWCSSSTTPG